MILVQLGQYISRRCRYPKRRISCNSVSKAQTSFFLEFVLIIITLDMKFFPIVE